MHFPVYRYSGQETKHLESEGREQGNKERQRGSPDDLDLLSGGRRSPVKTGAGEMCQGKTGNNAGKVPQETFVFEKNVIDIRGCLPYNCFCVMGIVPFRGVAQLG